jgi:hypothetical protein
MRPTLRRVPSLANSSTIASMMPSYRLRPCPMKACPPLLDRIKCGTLRPSSRMARLRASPLPISTKDHRLRLPNSCTPVTVSNLKSGDAIPICHRGFLPRPFPFLRLLHRRLTTLVSRPRQILITTTTTLGMMSELQHSLGPIQLHSSQHLNSHRVSVRPSNNERYPWAPSAACELERT